MTHQNKRSGLYLDHSHAHLIEYNGETKNIETILSKFTHRVKIEALTRSENIMHNKEQQEQYEYFKKIGTYLKPYNQIVLFGPTTAKTELMNLLLEDSSFNKTQLSTETTDKLTMKEQYAFVKHYFEREEQG
jgi:hypothetical protein